MVIRLADKNDIEGIKTLIDRNFDEIISKYHSPETVKKFKDFNSAERLKEQLQWKIIYVASDKDRIVATGAFADFGTAEKSKFSVSNLYVLPELHGRGIGSEIMKILVRHAKERDAGSFHVPSTRNAVAFYEKCGFSVDSVQPEAEDEIAWMTMVLNAGK